MTLKDAAELVETRLDDLQAEMEAGSRCATRLGEEAADLDGRLAISLRTAERTGELLRRVGELHRSLHQQRALMRHLRIEVRSLRVKLARARPPADLP
jgi:hypothetical protein